MYGLDQSPALTVRLLDGALEHPEPPHLVDRSSAAVGTARVGGGNISDPGAYYDEIRYFVDCVKDQRPPQIVTPEGARTAVEIIQAEITSARTGVPVAVGRATR